MLYPTIDVLVLDPSICPAEEFESIASLIRWKWNRVVLYADLSPRAMRDAFRLSRLGISELVIAGTADEIDQLSRACFVNGPLPVGHHVAAQLASRLLGLPGLLRTELGSLFVRPAPIPCVEHLAEGAGLTRRSLDRHLAQIGLRASGVVVSAAQLCSCYAHLRNRHVSERRISTMLGHSSIEPVRRQCELVLGRSLEQTRQLIDPDVFATAIAHGLLRADLQVGVFGPVSESAE